MKLSVVLGILHSLTLYSPTSSLPHSLTPPLTNSSTTHHYSHLLPKKLTIGYASWSECDDKITTAVEQGVNVVVWFAINLLTDANGEPVITGGPDLNCVAEKKAEYEARGLVTTHLISIGGW